MAHIIDAAQMTHPVSSAEDIEMHDIATPRRRIGGRCHKWAVSTQATNKRNCAACTMCSLQFTPGEPRPQQWANRNAQRAYVHAQCVTGGIQAGHELVPKTPTDTEARDAVLRIRDKTLEAAAEAEVVLSIHDPHDDNSTEAPEDEDTLFDREKALRHDDAIMDFQWFKTIGWSALKLTANARALPVLCATTSSRQANHDCNSGPTEAHQGTTYRHSAYPEA